MLSKISMRPRWLVSPKSRKVSLWSPCDTMLRVLWGWEAYKDSPAWGGITVKFPRITRRITMLLAASALLLVIPAAATASAASATTGTGWIRLAHLSPKTPAVDVYLYSFGNSHAQNGP